jgi:hypothetical protein
MGMILDQIVHQQGSYCPDLLNYTSSITPAKLNRATA